MNEFIKKSHEIVFSQLDLSAVEYDIFALMLKRLAYLDREEYFDDDGEPNQKGKSISMTVTSEEIQAWFRISPSKFKNVLYDPCERLSSKKIGMRGEDSFRFTPLFKDIRYKDGKLTIVPNDMLLSQYFGGSLGYAKISELEFRSLKRESSKKLYSILSRFKESGAGKVGAKTLQELYGYFGMLDESGELKKKAYYKFSNFSYHVIIPAIAEIEEIDPRVKFYSDAEQPQNHGFKTYKTGRKITKVEFLYYWQGTEEEKVINLTPIDRAKAVHAKIVAQEEVTEKELKLLKKHLTDLVISGFDICDLARIELQKV